MDNIKKLKTTGLFTNYIYKAIPLAFDESMSYYETLCGLLAYLKDTVIPTVNNNADAVIDLQNLYTQLKDYVDNYFTNLDVQEEINNKLDEMASSGELTALIKNYIDPIQEQFENSINNEISNFETGINNRVENIENKVNVVSEGSPKGVYATVSDLESADPNHNYIYLVIDDGNWYYYNTSNNSWTAGGIYQSTGLANKSVFTNNFEDYIQDRIGENVPFKEICNYNSIIGKYMNLYGTYISNVAFNAYEYEVKQNDKFNLDYYIRMTDNFPTYVLLNDNNVVEVGETMNQQIEEHFNKVITIPSGVNKLVINTTVRNPNNTTILNIEDVKNIKLKQNNIINVLAPYKEKNPETTIVGKYIQEDIANNTLIFNNLTSFQYFVYNVNAGERLKLKFTPSDNTIYACILTDNDNALIELNYWMKNLTPNEEVTKEILIPTNATKMYIQSLKTYNITVEERVMVNNSDIINNNADPYMNFNIKNLERRCSNLENQNPFAWKSFDKAYFAFVIDDCNAYFPKAVEIFHNNSVPLSSATLINKLNEVYTSYTPNNTKTVKELLDDMVTEGGEVLAHYTGNLAPAGTPDTQTKHYLTTEADWLLRTRDVKKTLEDNGYNVRGIITADSTIRNTSTGQKYCQLYFEYSDGLGTSKNFDLKRKMFLSADMKTLEQVKAYIDRCCQTPGFYPLCFHGTRQDEPMITEPNLNAILNYIASKGSDVCECSTYSNVIDKFGSTELEQRISQLES